MDLFRGIEPFVSVAEAQSFTQAAAALGVSAAAVSKAVSKLEAELGVSLFTRTSRRVRLTPEGEQFFLRCRDAQRSVQAGRELVSHAQRVPQGNLRVTLSPVLAEPVMQALPPFVAQHPRLSLHLNFTDRFTRLGEDDTDVALRIGELDDSSLIGRLLRRTRWATVAAPAYLAQRGVPQRPADLAGHECIKFVLPRGVRREWQFGGGKRRGGKLTTAPTGGALSLDNGALLLDAARAGLGLVQVFDFMIDADSRAGRLVEVLADYAGAGPPIHALVLPGRSRSPKVVAFLDFARRAIGGGDRRR